MDASNRGFAFFIAYFYTPFLKSLLFNIR